MREAKTNVTLMAGTATRNSVFLLRPNDYDYVSTSSILLISAQAFSGSLLIAQLAAIAVL